MNSTQYPAHFQFAKNGKRLGKSFSGVIIVSEIDAAFRNTPITFWFGLAELRHQTEDREFLLTHSHDPETFIWVEREDGRLGRGVCVAGDAAGDYYGLAIAGCESFQSRREVSTKAREVLE
jgi:hypothetical protein